MRNPAKYLLWFRHEILLLHALPDIEDLNGKRRRGERIDNHSVLYIVQVILMIQRKRITRKMTNVLVPISVA